MTDGSEKRTQYLRRYQDLRSERSSWDAHAQECADYVLPRKFRLYGSDVNKGTKKNDKIINATPTRSLRVCVAGVTAGTCSPARPWFKYGLANPKDEEKGDVRQFLHTAELVSRMVFARTNLYNAMIECIESAVAFGTGVMWVDEDWDDILRAYVFPFGSYCLSQNEKNQVDTMYREVQMTARQMVRKFGYDAVSSSVKTAYDTKKYEQRFEVLHIIEPNDFRDDSMGPRGMAYRSCWLESKTGDGLLLESGYREKPFMAFRWNKTGEDVYGTGPVMDALGDIKQLQFTEKRKMKAVDKIVDPPLAGSASLRNSRVSILPGDVTYIPDGNVQALRAIHEVSAPSLQVIGAEIPLLEERIRSVMMEDLMLAVMSTTGVSRTATEVDAIRTEKMMQLGPVLERMGDELFDPLMDRVFNICMHRGLFPPPPQELGGQEINIEYISILFEAQKQLATTGMERFAQFALQAMQVNPDVGDKIDWDEMMDQYRDALGVAPSIVRSDDAVAEMRQQRAAAQQAQIQQQQALESSQAVKNLASAKLDDESALTRISEQMGGVASAMAGTGA